MKKQKSKTTCVEMPQEYIDSFKKPHEEFDWKQSKKDKVISDLLTQLTAKNNRICELLTEIAELEEKLEKIGKVLNNENLQTTSNMLREINKILKDK
jgi:hypothetical protein